MCRFYDTRKAKSCAEPVADEVQDKQRANFCGYFVAAAYNLTRMVRLLRGSPA